MHQNGNDGGGGHAARRHVLIFEYDESTHQVAIAGDPIPLSLAQMICDEGARILDHQRRMASVEALKAAAAREQDAARFACQMRNRG